MNIKFLDHNNTIGNSLITSLSSGLYKDFKAVVAYSKNSGISYLYKSLQSFSAAGGRSSFILGVDQKNTSFQALVNLKSFASDSMFIHHNSSFQVTFHPKIYLLGNSQLEKVIIGSSNLTAGGLFLNYEANVEIDLDNTPESSAFSVEIDNYWSALGRHKNTVAATMPLLENLLSSDQIIDETKQKSFKDLIKKIGNLPFSSEGKLRNIPTKSVLPAVPVPVIKSSFIMTLSGFDVSSRSLDPVILIPIAALRANPGFWVWPDFYTLSNSNYPQLYALAEVFIDGTRYIDQHIRIYYYEKKKEFRLQCSLIKRNGQEGDILRITKSFDHPLNFSIELIRSDHSDFSRLISSLVNKVSKNKFYTYAAL